MVCENRILSFNTLHTTATTQCILDFVGKGWKIELSSNALHFTIPSFCHTIYLCKSLHLCMHRIIIYSTFQQVLEDWLYSVILEIGVICFMGVPRYLVYGVTVNRQGKVYDQILPLYFLVPHSHNLLIF